MDDLSAKKECSPPEAPSGPPLYNIAVAAPGYSNVTGLVSTFAFAAVVLVFGLAATTPGGLTRIQSVDSGFATILFSLGFLGCLISAYAFASLGAAPNTRVLVTNSMLVASVVAVGLVAVLGGFEALARAFLPKSAAAFAVICAASAFLSPVLVWFPLYDIALDFLKDGTPVGTSRDPGAAQSPPAKEAMRHVAGLTCVGLLAAAAGLVLHFRHTVKRHTPFEYYVLGFWGLAYTALVIVGALLLARKSTNHLPYPAVWIINLIQCLFMAALIAVLP